MKSELLPFHAAFAALSPIVDEGRLTKLPRNSFVCPTKSRFPNEWMTWVLIVAPGWAKL